MEMFRVFKSGDIFNNLDKSIRLLSTNINALFDI